MQNELDEKFNAIFSVYSRIIYILLDKRREDGILCISQVELAEAIGCSRTLIASKLHRLEEVDKVIEKVGRGMYRVNHTNLLTYGPIERGIRLMKLYDSNPALYKQKYKEQAQFAQMSTKEFQIAKGYAEYFRNKN